MHYEMFDTDSKIHISAGLPCLSATPFSKILEDIINDFRKEKDPNLLQYGCPSGYLRFREALACFIGNKEQRVINPTHLFVTNGATHGILLSIITLSKGKASVIVERPTYFPLLDLFKELKLNICFADVDENGISTVEIEKYLQYIPEKETVFIHCTPYFQNPTGVNMNERRTDKLLDIVKKYPNAWLLLDNVYKYLNFTGNNFGNLFCGDIERVISICSFSKIFGPGLRVGWLETEPSIISMIEESGYVQSSGGFNPVVCRLIENIVRTGRINDIIETWVEFLKHKQLNLVGALKSIFPEAEFYRPKGGYYIWADLKNSLLANVEFRKFMKDKKSVVYVPGTKCAGDINLYQTYIRLGFATYSDDRLVLGLEKLKEAFKEFKSH